MEGTCTGEHGVGVGKKPYLVKEVGVEAIDLMRDIKRALDPQGLLNPGKVFDLHSEKIDSGPGTQSGSTAKCDAPKYSQAAAMSGCCGCL